jgi:hypothetical protein
VDRWGGGFALIEEDVRDVLVRCVRLAAEVLDHIDSRGRISRVALVVATPGAGHMGWQTRAEAAASEGSVRVAMSGSDEPMQLSPPDRARAALVFDTESLAADFTVLLKRVRGF